LASAEMSNQKDLERILESSDWQKLIDQLMDYVEDFSTKIVLSRKGFQM
jgi:hypothetical protein